MGNCCSENDEFKYQVQYINLSDLGSEVKFGNNRNPNVKLVLK